MVSPRHFRMVRTSILSRKPHGWNRTEGIAISLRLQTSSTLLRCLILTRNTLDKVFRNTRLHPLSANLRRRRHRLRSHRLCAIDRSGSDCWSSGQLPFLSAYPSPDEDLARSLRTVWETNMVLIDSSTVLAATASRRDSRTVSSWRSWHQWCWLDHRSREQ